MASKARASAAAAAVSSSSSASGGSSSSAAAAAPPPPAPLPVGAADLAKLKAISRHLASDYMQGLQGLSGMYDLGTPGEYSTASILRMLEHVRAHCGLTADSLFCDVGSGLGRPVFAAVLSGAFPRAVGVEIVAEQVAAAQATAAKFGLAPPAVAFVHADATKHGLPPDTDVVYMFSQGFAPGLLAGVAARMNAHRKWRFLVSATKPAKWAEAGLRFHGGGSVTLNNMQMVGSARRYALYVLARHPPRPPPLSGKGKAKPAAAAAVGAASSASAATASSSSSSSSSAAAALPHAPAAAGRKRPRSSDSSAAEAAASSSGSSSSSSAAAAPPARRKVKATNKKK